MSAVTSGFSWGTMLAVAGGILLAGLVVGLVR
jgi:hypothetical protein